MIPAKMGANRCRIPVGEGRGCGYDLQRALELSGGDGRVSRHVGVGERVRVVEEEKHAHHVRRDVDLVPRKRERIWELLFWGGGGCSDTGQPARADDSKTGRGISATRAHHVGRHVCISCLREEHDSGRSIGNFARRVEGPQRRRAR